MWWSVKSLIIKTSVLVLLVVAFIVLQLHFDIISFLSPDTINALLEEFGGMAPIIFMLAMACAIVISPIPSLPLSVAAGAFFGPFFGTLYSTLGALIGAVVSFLLARILGRELIERVLRRKLRFCPKCTVQVLTRIVFFSRLLPVVSFDVISYGAGLTSLPIKNFAIATFLGMLPLTFVYNYFGSVLIISSWLAIIIGVSFVILLFLLPRWVHENNFLDLRKFLHAEEKDTYPNKSEKGCSGSRL